MDLETPAAIIDLDKVEANIHRLQVYLDKIGVENWPHIKTHKIPALAKMQLAAGAKGVVCQKVSEAEVFVNAGIGTKSSPIFIPYNILGKTKTRRLMALVKRAEISVTADSAITINGLSEAAQEADVVLSVLIEFDAGMGRCGVQMPAAAATLARLTANSPGLHFAGLMTYPNRPEIKPFIQEVKKLLQPDGLTVERISGGGTPGIWQVEDYPEVTEHRAGTYIYGDRAMVNSGVMTYEQCALHILATVVSRPTPSRGILDSGAKTLSNDLFGLEGYGYILQYPQAKIYNLSEEHGFVDFTESAGKPIVGQQVTIIPNHCCLVSNLFNEIVAVRNGQVETIWPVAARGCLQ